MWNFTYWKKKKIVGRNKPAVFFHWFQFNPKRFLTWCDNFYGINCHNEPVKWVAITRWLLNLKSYLAPNSMPLLKTKKYAYQWRTSVEILLLWVKSCILAADKENWNTNEEHWATSWLRRQCRLVLSDLQLTTGTQYTLLFDFKYNLGT